MDIAVIHLPLIEPALDRIDHRRRTAEIGIDVATVEVMLLEQIGYHANRALLTIQPHSYFDELHDTDRCLAPRHVKKVEEYIEGHADESLTPAQLAEYAGVSVRTLYSGFHDFRHQGPMEYLRTVRLQKVKAALEEPGESRSVTEIALSWGFSHIGRFSQEYRKAFGERPSETKRKFTDH